MATSLWMRRFAMIDGLDRTRNSHASTPQETLS
jgi:hypothetical protein